MSVLICAVIGYLLGSFPTGVVLARIMGLGDLRKLGSGNTGATNVLRTGNKVAAALTLVGDAGKGILAVLIAQSLGGPIAVQVAAFAAFIGHCWPVWLGFRGGKGVATYLGVTLALAFPVGLAACLMWLWAAAMMRMSSLAALIASAAAVPFALCAGRSDLIVLMLALTGLLYWRHSANLSRIAQGTEPRIGA